MRSPISKEKIYKINELLAHQNDNIERGKYFHADQQQQALQNRHVKPHLSSSRKAFSIPKNAFNIEKQISAISAISPTTSRVFLKSSAHNKMDEIDEMMNIELKEESRVGLSKRQSSKHFKRYEFKSQQVVSQLKQSNQLSISKVFNQTNQSTDFSRRKAKKLTDIHYEVVKRYFSDKIGKINASSKPADLYKIISPFCQLCKVDIDYPLVKLYKNCFYFGERSSQKDQNYQGIIIFYQRRRLYYGGFANEKKNGYGIQIDFNDGSVYMGHCINGQKVSDFTVVRLNETYKGPLANWQYQGYGELTTKTSIYKGQFQKGQRHGEGKEYFPQSKLTLSGIFIHNQFWNQQQSRIRNSKQKHRDPQHLNPECLDFNYELNEGIHRKSSKSSSFRIKRQGGNIVRQSNRMRSIEQQDPLINSRFRK